LFSTASQTAENPNLHPSHLSEHQIG